MAVDVPDASAKSLEDKLRASGGNVTECLGLLWTWLTHHQILLGSLAAKVPTIRQRALKLEGITTIEEEHLDALAGAPVRMAAELLARLEIGLTPHRGLSLTQEVVGFDGRAVIVCWKQPTLAALFGAKDEPPAIKEHPALQTLAPRLVVVPKDVGGVKLEIARPSGLSWTAAMTAISAGAPTDDAQAIAIYLDPLGSSGLDAWTPPYGGSARLDGTLLSDSDAKVSLQTIAAAISNASGDAPSLLILPELGVAPSLLPKIQQMLADADEPPALTVIGLFHDSIPADEKAPPENVALLGTDRIAEYVNEAVVLGPDGTEFWRHRKLTSAEGPIGEETVVEDIQLGKALRVVMTPLGSLAVVICLDSFAAHSRNRIASSGADGLLIPSFSPSVRRHRDSLTHLVHSMWAAAFVCNRGMKVDPGDPEALWNGEKARSFWAVQSSGPVTPEPWSSGHGAFVATPPATT